MGNALRIEQDAPYNFYRGEQVLWKRNSGEPQAVLYVEKMKHGTSKVVNPEGLLMIVFTFELSRPDEG